MSNLWFARSHTNIAFVIKINANHLPSDLVKRWKISRKTTQHVKRPLFSIKCTIHYNSLNSFFRLSDVRQMCICVWTRVHKPAVIINIIDILNFHETENHSKCWINEISLSYIIKMCWSYDDHRWENGKQVQIHFI